jgi:DNA-directed RNA polymerase subunit beta'
MVFQFRKPTDDATGISSKSVIDWRAQSKSTDLKPRNNFKR